MIVGGWSVTTMRIKSELVEGRGVSLEDTKGEGGGFAKARSSIDGLEIVSNRNWV